MTTRRTFFMAMLAAALAVASCVPEGQASGEGGDSFVASAPTFRASVDGSAVLWHSGDEIALFAGDDGKRNESAIYRTSLKTPSGVARFTAVGETKPALEEGRYLAVFPPSSIATWGSVGKNSVYVDIPAAQTATPGSWDPACGIMASSSENREIYFSHIPAYIRFYVEESSPEIVLVRVESPDGISLADRMYVRFEKPLFIKENGTASKMSPSVTLSTSDGSPMKQGSYLISINPRVLPSGLKFTFTDSRGHSKTTSVSGRMAFTPGQIVDIGPIGENLFNDVFELPFSQNFYLQDAVAPLRQDLATLKFRIMNPLHTVSVRLNASGRKMAGTVIRDADGVCSIGDGQDFIVFNTMRSEGPADVAGGVLEVPVLIAPGTYEDGIDARICDLGHGVMNQHIPAFTLTSGQVKTVDISYERDSGVVFFDGFDLCVWGGRYGAGEGDVFMSPVSINPGAEANPSLTGFEAPAYKVSSDCPGTGLIQPDTWGDVSGKTLEVCHSMSESYVRSRNFSDYTYLYRTQEFQGCVGVSTATDNRGSFRTPRMSGMPYLGSAVLEFDVYAQKGYADSFETRIIDGGYISAVSIDGTPLSLTATSNYYKEASAYLVVPNAEMAPGGSWVHFSLSLEHVCDQTSVQIYPSSTKAMTHGFLLDNLKLTAVKKLPKPSGFRLLYWNVQDGMWADQENDYGTFVEWVKKFDPDVCVWCEGGSIFKTQSDDYLASSDKYLPSNWPAIAARYGHQYASNGAVVNNYPQIITSKYPITTVQQIGVPPGETQRIRSGAGMFSINLNGRTVNFVTLHLYAQKYRPDCPAAEQAASSAAGEGAQFKAWEMGKILDLTRLNPEYSSRTDWLMMGDFNSRAPVDNFYYGLDANDIDFLPHKDIASRTDYVDLIAARYPGWFFWSNPSSRRIDFVFASPSMASRVSDAFIVIDSWANPRRSPFSADRYTPSDHRPILVDFN